MWCRERFAAIAGLHVISARRSIVTPSPRHACQQFRHSHRRPRHRRPTAIQRCQRKRHRRHGAGHQRQRARLRCQRSTQRCQRARHRVPGRRGADRDTPGGPAARRRGKQRGRARHARAVPRCARRRASRSDLGYRELAGEITRRP
jgi:hypothetical protein